MSLSKEFLEAEIEFILECRKDFWFFCLYMDSAFFVKRQFGRPIAKAMQDVAERKIMKLMVSLPPRALKSYITSLFCSWYLGNYPTESIMRNTYGQELANKLSYDVRAIVQSPKYQRIFPFIKLRSDKANIVDWAIEQSRQTAYFCAGVGGAVTGKGASGMAILDDSIKDVESAMSEVILEKTWNWYTGVHKARMEKNCPEMQIGTRWSKKDILGRLIEAEGEQWTQIVIPALDENGKSFCEDVKTTDEYLKLKKLTDSLIWEAEFMQNPIEAKGLLFPINELNRFTMNDLKHYEDDSDKTFRYDSVIGYTDTADEGTDFLVSLTAKTVAEKHYITDVVCTDEKVEITEPLVAQQIIQTKQVIHTVESNNGGKGFARNLQTLINGKSRADVSWIAKTTNKETRILMKSGQVKSYFYFMKDYEAGSDYDRFMRQLTSYSKAGKNKHDDSADAVTGLAEILLTSQEIEFA